MASYAQRAVWERNARAVGLRWRAYAGLIVVTVADVALLTVLPDFPLKQAGAGFVLGAIAMVLVVGAANILDPRTSGLLSEQWSNEAFKKQRGWLTVANLAFDRIDVDHVVVTPAGVLAVETKFRGHGYTGYDLATDRRRSDLDAARAAARKIGLFLRSKKLADLTEVHPVLVVWGPGRPALPDGHTLVDGVYVLDGEHPQLWSHLFAAPLLVPDLRARIHDELRGYAQVRDQHRAAAEQRTSRRIWDGFRGGVAQARVQRAERAGRVAALRRRHRAA